MATEPFIGRWKIVKCVPDFCDPGVDHVVLQGCEFELTSDGDVFWYPQTTASLDSSPLFQCTTFEVLREREGLSVVVSLRFGAYKGQIIEFDVEVNNPRRDAGVATSASTGAVNAASATVPVAAAATISSSSSTATSASSPPSDPMMLLTYSGLICLHCQQIRKSPDQRCGGGNITKSSSSPFDLSTALDEALFADLEIVGATGKKFEVHRIILETTLPSLDWTSQPPPLSGLPDAVLETLLHFLYARCLPEGITVERVDQCLKELADRPEFQEFADHATAFKDKSAICQKLMDIVNEMHGAANAIILEFRGRPLYCSTHRHHQQQQQQLTQNPSLLSNAIKQSLRHLALCGVRLAQLCHLFARKSPRLSREEQHEVVAYAKRCLPVFLKQLKRLLSAMKQSCSPMRLHIRQELAAHFVPELEAFSEVLNQLGCEVREVLEAMLQADTDRLKRENLSRDGNDEDDDDAAYEEDGPKSPEGAHRKRTAPSADDRDNDEDDDDEDSELPFSFYLDPSIGFSYKMAPGRRFTSLKNTLEIKEVYKLKMSHSHLVTLLSYLLQEKEAFVKQCPAVKVRLIAWQLEQTIDEMPLFVMRLGEFSSILDEKLDFGTFKFCFVVGATLIDNLLMKLREHRSSLEPLLEHLCSLIESDELSAALAEMDLLPPNRRSSNSSSSRQQQQQQQQQQQLYSTDNRLFFDRRLCRPPPALGSPLSYAMEGLFLRRDNDPNTDMTIVVKASAEEDNDDDDGRNGQDEAQEAKEELFPCHRAILAARCPYFKRALRSGMKEAIERRILVQDASPSVFRLFLSFLYCGRLDPSACSSVDTLSELLMLADRYEMDSLKTECESALKANMDSDETVAALLQVADHFNAENLKSYCEEYVLDHPSVLKSAGFCELSASLQMELQELVTWGQRAEERSMGAPPAAFSDLADMALNLRLGSQSTEDDLANIPLTLDSAQLDACVSQLRDVLGPLIHQDQLVRVALAADYNVNRALNFFFNGEEGAEE